MSLLVIVTLMTPDDTSIPIIIGFWLLATGWTGMTVIARQVGFLGRNWFVMTDGLAMLGLGASSSFAGAENLIHGGMPMSWIFVVAYAANARWALGASLLLGAEQVVVHGIDDRGSPGAVGSVVFLVFAAVAGWAFDELRSSEAARNEAKRQLAIEQERVAEERLKSARHEQREQLANRLHDSVLQTLLVIRNESEDAERVRYLSRRQERELRHTIDEFTSPHEESFKAALHTARDEIEDLYSISIQGRARDDAEMSPALAAAVEATREALINAAKHARVEVVDLYSDIVDGWAHIYVRDRGVGFDPDDDSAGHGLKHSIAGRLKSAGGHATIRSTIGSGTEVEIAVRVAP